MRILTPTHFYQHAACPHWIWYDAYGDAARKGEVPELAQKLMARGVVHEEEYVRGLAYEEVSAKDPAEAFAQTLAFMRRGVERIYQGAIEANIGGAIWRGRPDLLERRPGRSAFGAYHYAPVDIKSSHRIHKEQEAQLTFYAIVLRAVQGAAPRETAIINVDRERVAFFPTATHAAKVRARAREILAIMDGHKPPPRLTSKCRRSPWFRECVREAEETGDIALIYDLDSRAHPALRAAGIKTVRDAAAMDPRALPDIPYAPLETLRRAKLQAQALVADELRWVARPNVPDAPLRLYFDIEGDPLLDVQYLFGLWIESGSGSENAGEARYVRFLAERPEDERRAWEEFLAFLDTLPEEYVVFHYADYERAHTLRLAREYGGSLAFDRFASRYVDLLRVVKESVVLPLYFYSIKDIAKSKFLNYHWRHEKAGGAQSIFWYEQWLESGDRSILQNIVDYNEDDVVATAHLRRWLADCANESR